VQGNRPTTQNPAPDQGPRGGLLVLWQRSLGRPCARCRVGRARLEFMASASGGNGARSARQQIPRPDRGSADNLDQYPQDDNAAVRLHLFQRRASPSIPGRRSDDECEPPNPDPAKSRH
jgi:hypothetical protein